MRQHVSQLCKSVEVDNRKKMLVYILIELLLYTLNSKCFGQTLDSDEVVINQGIIKGELKYVAGKAIYYFLGIPFAKAPMGDLRFKPPTTHPGWQVSLCQFIE